MSVMDLTEGVLEGFCLLADSVNRVACLHAKALTQLRYAWNAGGALFRSMGTPMFKREACSVCWCLVATCYFAAPLSGFKGQ